jgi:hypothetical protein
VQKLAVTLLIIHTYRFEGLEMESNSNNTVFMVKGRKAYCLIEYKNSKNKPPLRQYNPNLCSETKENGRFANLAKDGEKTK